MSLSAQNPSGIQSYGLVQSGFYEAGLKLKGWLGFLGCDILTQRQSSISLNWGAQPKEPEIEIQSVRLWHSLAHRQVMLCIVVSCPFGPWVEKKKKKTAFSFWWIDKSQISIQKKCTMIIETCDWTRLHDTEDNFNHLCRLLQT